MITFKKLQTQTYKKNTFQDSLLAKMNRRPQIQKQFRQQQQWMQKQQQDYDDDNFQNDYDDYNDDQWEQICHIAETLNIDNKRSAEALDKFDFNQEKAINYLVNQLEKQAAKQDKKKQKKQPQQQQKIPKLDETSMSGLSNISKKKSEQPVRKISSQEMPAGTRKSSLIVQEYQKDHYNMDYPDLQIKQQVQPSKTINIVVVGHVDSGKSTLVGKLMHLIGQISKKQLHKNQKQAKQLGQAGSALAYITDQTQLQKQKGITIDIGVKKIMLKDRNIVFLDSPGHRDFIPNMITGAAQADYAILVIDVTHFDSTFISGGQTKEHAYIVKSLGVQTIIVVVNKMDAVNWSAQAFETIRNKLNYYLYSIGFVEQHIIYIPISATQGTNLHPSTLKPFKTNSATYSTTLISQLQQLPLPTRPINKPLRINITNFYESPTGKIKGHCLSGKIQGGILKKDEKYVILPQDCQCIVKDILLGNEKVKEAVVGDNVQVQIKLIDQMYFQTIKFGNVLSSILYCVPVSKNFVMEAMALELEAPILKGTDVMIYIGSNKATARITKIFCKYDPKTGAVIKKNCKSIHSNDCVSIEVQSDQPVCIEKFSNSKIFGRVIIRQKSSTLCVGTVTMIK